MSDEEVKVELEESPKKVTKSKKVTLTPEQLESRQRAHALKVQKSVVGLTQKTIGAQRLADEETRKSKEFREYITGGK